LAPGVTEPFFEFFAQQCNTDVKYLTSTISPELAEKCQLPDFFNFDDPHAPILIIEDIGYDENDAPVFLSLEYLAGEASSFHVIRHVENF